MPLISRTSQSSLARSFELWWQFTLRAVELRHRGSFFGLFWSVLNPLMGLALYATVFGVIFKGRFRILPDETPADYTLAVFLGLILFHVLADTIAVAPTLIIGSPNFVKKVVFPLEILPLSSAGALWFHFLISFALLMLSMLIFGRGVPLSGLVYIPFILVPIIALSVGLGLLLSAVGVFFRDISQFVGVLIQIMLYASAVFYPIAIVPTGLWAWLRWNPFLQSVDLARRALLWNQPVNLLALGYTWAFGLGVCILGWWVFRRSKPAFADVI